MALFISFCNDIIRLQIAEFYFFTQHTIFFINFDAGNWSCSKNEYFGYYNLLNWAFIFEERGQLLNWKIFAN